MPFDQSVDSIHQMCAAEVTQVGNCYRVSVQMPLSIDGRTVEVRVTGIGSELIKAEILDWDYEAPSAGRLCQMTHEPVPDDEAAEAGELPSNV